MTEAWSGPAVQVLTASEFAGHTGQIWQELKSDAVIVVMDGKTGSVRGYVTRDMPESLRGAEHLIPGLSRPRVTAGAST